MAYKNIEARRAAGRRWYAANKDRKKATSEKWKKAHSLSVNRAARKRYANEPERQRDRARKYYAEKYGLPAPVKEKPNACECCGRLFDDKVKANFDHCHFEGHHRGWLCGSCNRGIGLLGDNIFGVLSALNYLLRGIYFAVLTR